MLRIAENGFIAIRPSVLPWQARGLLGLVNNTSLLRDMQDHFTKGALFSATVAT